MSIREELGIDEWSSSLPESEELEWVFLRPENDYNDPDEMENYFQPSPTSLDTEDSRDRTTTTTTSTNMSSSVHESEESGGKETLLTHNECIAQYGKEEDDGFEFTRNLLHDEDS